MDKLELACTGVFYFREYRSIYIDRVSLVDLHSVGISTQYTTPLVYQCTIHRVMVPIMLT